VELSNVFGDVTAHWRSPADGAWKANGQGISYGEVVIYEVMVEQHKRGLWQEYRRQLEGRFRQEKLLIRAIAVEEL